MLVSSRFIPLRGSFYFSHYEDFMSDTNAVYELCVTVDWNPIRSAAYWDDVASVDIDPRLFYLMHSEYCEFAIHLQSSSVNIDIISLNVI